MNPPLKFLILAALLVIFFNPTSVNTQCLSRNAIKARGESWVGKVPYNHHRLYDGYRTDCSGFISMCWALPKPGATTFTLENYATVISETDLKLGDAIICPG